MEKLLEILKKMKPGVDFEKEDDKIKKKVRFLETLEEQLASYEVAH